MTARARKQKVAPEAPNDKAGRRKSKERIKVTDDMENETIYIERLNTAGEEVPEKHRDDFLAHVEALAAQFKKEAAKPAYTAPPLPQSKADMKAMGIKTYDEVFPAYYRIDEDELEAFTKKNWGPWLASCNEGMEIDAITRKQIRALDPKLYSKLMELTPEKRGRVIQTKSMGITEEADLLTEEKIKESIKIRNIAVAKGLIPEAA